MYTRFLDGGLYACVQDGKISLRPMGETKEYFISRDDIIDVLAHAACEGFMDDNLEGLGLSNRTYRALRRAEINSIGELMDMSPDRLRSLRCIGKTSIAEINRKIADYKEKGIKQNEQGISYVFAMLKHINFQSSTYSAVDAVLEVAEEMIYVLLDKEKGASEETPG